MTQSVRWSQIFFYRGLWFGKMNKKELMKRLIFGSKNLRFELLAWLKVVFTRGIWAFFPVILAIFIGYWYHNNNYTQESVKYYCEFIAVVLMGLTVLIFLIRVVLYKLKLDIVFLLVSIGFLCREIHFVGTDTLVVVVVAVAGVLAWWWRDDILNELTDKNQLKAVIFCMCWSYLVTLLIQRRAFSVNHLGLLPDEELIHINLEEITENAAHLAFFAIGVVSFFYKKTQVELPAGNEKEEKKKQE